MKTILLCLAVALSVSACSSDMLLARTDPGGLTVFDQRNLKTVVSDQQIKRDFESQVSTLEAFDSSHIVISSFDHEVLLVGQTPHASLRVNAEKIAQRLPGVTKVYNEIQIQPETTTLTRTNDAWITAKVKANMLTQAGLHASQIKVVTENSMVYLMGKVTPQQGRLAVFVARHVNGVTKVVKVFNYPDQTS